MSAKKAIKTGIFIDVGNNAYRHVECDPGTVRRRNLIMAIKMMSEKILILSEMRKLQNISRDEIAKKLGINQSSVARAEVGIPAISAEYITQMCNILSVNPDYLKDKSDYPFIPGAFIKLHIKGLSARIRPLAWLDLLLKYTKRIDILLLLQEGKGNVVAACAKDDKDTVFLVSVDIPLTREYVLNCPDPRFIKSEKVRMAINYFFHAHGKLDFYKSFASLDKMSKEDIENLIDKAFADVLSNEEKKLIKLIREKKIPINNVFDLAKKINKREGM
jgi:transcriptional regulator with XRE-family HTH domain